MRKFPHAGLLLSCVLVAGRAFADDAPTSQSAVPKGFACAAKPKVTLRTKDGQALAVAAVDVDENGVGYIEKTPFDGERPGGVAWTMMTSAEAAKALEAVCDPKDPAQLAFAGRVMGGLPGGGPREAAKWYAKARKAAGKEAPPAIAAMVEASEKTPAVFPPLLIPGRGGGMPAGRSPSEWPAESGGVMREAVRLATEDTGKALAKAKLRPKLYQNNLFLLYSDLDEAETRRWAGRFQNIYEGLCKAFGINPQQNIWHGKAVVLLFRSREEYLAYHAAAGRNAQGSAGLSVSDSLGNEEISMFQDPGNPDLTHVLYHEFAHGFVHRYKAAQPVQSWVNEGLAEFMAARFVGNNHSRTPRVAMETAQLARAKSFEDFFAAKQIQGKHYGVAEDLTRMLVECDPKRYAAFIAWIKHGLAPDEALRRSYDLTVEDLVKAYGKRIGVEGLKSH